MRKLLIIAGIVAVAIAAARMNDVKIVELKDGIVRIETKGYSFEIPKEWTVGKETPWGARDIKSTTAGGKLGTMTANAQSETWDSLYRTSLYFITREEKGEPTPYRQITSKMGYEGIAFEVLDEKQYAKRRFVLIKNKEGRALALSVDIKNPKDEKKILQAFDRMVDTATIR
ncbi:MAG: hypothetical protein JNJ45_12865 [Chthonomonas sp.]|nr:hypothetical protein [Chthonomonas sp.]